MKKGWKIFWVCLLLVVSLGGKVLITYECFERNDAYLWFKIVAEVIFHTSAERLVYGVDALLVLLTFSALAGRLKHLVSKILVGIVINIGYIAALLTCNYCWQALRWNFMFNWEPPLCTPVDMARWGFERYLAYGYPGYHWLIIGMFVACTAILLFKRYKRALAMKSKLLLLSCADKTKSVTLTMFCFDITLLFLKRYLFKEEFEWIKDMYTYIYNGIFSSGVDAKFDAAEKYIIDEVTTLEEVEE